MPELTNQQKAAIRAAWQAALGVIEAFTGVETQEAADAIAAAQASIAAYQAICPSCDPTDG